MGKKNGQLPVRRATVCAVGKVEVTARRVAAQPMTVTDRIESL